VKFRNVNKLFTLKIYYKLCKVRSYEDWKTGRSRFNPRQRKEDFSSNLCVQTGSGAHPASCSMRTGGPFPGGKTRPGCDADHSPPYSAEVVNE
jgi:hypothetical protein